MVKFGGSHDEWVARIVREFELVESMRKGETTKYDGSAFEGDLRPYIDVSFEGGWNPLRIDTLMVYVIGGDYVFELEGNLGGSTVNKFVATLNKYSMAGLIYPARAAQLSDAVRAVKNGNGNGETVKVETETVEPEKTAAPAPTTTVKENFKRVKRIIGELGFSLSKADYRKAKAETRGMVNADVTAVARTMAVALGLDDETRDEILEELSE
jgi:hypothetical protein